MTDIQFSPEQTGIHVFGSAIMQVAPDVASLNFAVARLEQHPKGAFDPGSIVVGGAVKITFEIEAA